MEGVIEIESEWTARKREKMGIRPKVKHRSPESLSNLDTAPFANTGSPDAPDLVQWGGPRAKGQATPMMT